MSKRSAAAANEAPRQDDVAVLNTFKVSQAPHDAIPIRQRSQFGQQAGTTLPVHLVHTNETTFVTLYPQQAWSDEQIRNSTATAVGDSVVVEVSGQQIRFRSSLLRQKLQVR
jgi:hypothetical protein